MKKLLILGSLFSVLVVRLVAEVQTPVPTGLSPRPDALFAPLRGDPRELQFALRVAKPENGLLAAEVLSDFSRDLYCAIA